MRETAAVPGVGWHRGKFNGSLDSLCRRVWSTILAISRKRVRAVAGGTVAAGGAGACGLSALYTLKLIYVKLMGKSLQQRTPGLGKSSMQ